MGRDRSLPIYELALTAVRAGLGRSLLPCRIGESVPEISLLSGAKPVLSREMWVIVHPRIRWQTHQAGKNRTAGLGDAPDGVGHGVQRHAWIQTEKADSPTVRRAGNLAAMRTFREFAANLWRRASSVDQAWSLANWAWFFLPGPLVGALTAMWAYISGQAGVIIFVLALAATTATAFAWALVRVWPHLRTLPPVPAPAGVPTLPQAPTVRPEAVDDQEEMSNLLARLQRAEEQISNIHGKSRTQSADMWHLVTVVQKMMCQRICASYAAQLRNIDFPEEFNDLDALESAAEQSDRLTIELRSLLRETRWSDNIGAVLHEAERLADQSIDELHSSGEIPNIRPRDLRKFFIAKLRSECVCKFLSGVQQLYDREFEADMQNNLRILRAYD